MKDFTDVFEVVSEKMLYGIHICFVKHMNAIEKNAIVCKLLAEGCLNLTAAGTEIL